MQIQIISRMRPFSHRPGTRIPIPMTRFEAAIFPTKIEIFREQSKLFEQFLDIEGPVKGFTVLLDLEKGRIVVWGESSLGYFRYALEVKEGFLIPITLRGIEVCQPFSIPVDPFPIQTTRERLSLGSHKKQEWEGIVSRGSLEEILPIWFSLSSWIPGDEKIEHELLEKLIASTNRLDLDQQIKNLFLAGFTHFFCPRTGDVNYQGLMKRSQTPEPMPSLLVESRKVLRSLFLNEKNGKVCLLPWISPNWHAGRFTNGVLSKGHLIHFEWTKKEIKKVIIQPNEDDTLNLGVHSESFRVRRGWTDPGAVVSAEAPIRLIKGETLYLDRFS